MLSLDKQFLPNLHNSPLDLVVNNSAPSASAKVLEEQAAKFTQAYNQAAAAQENNYYANFTHGTPVAQDTSPHVPKPPTGNPVDNQQHSSDSQAQSSANQSTGTSGQDHSVVPTPSQPSQPAKTSDEKPASTQSNSNSSSSGNPQSGGNSGTTSSTATSQTPTAAAAPSSSSSATGASPANATVDEGAPAADAGKSPGTSAQLGDAQNPLDQLAAGQISSPAGLAAMLTQLAASQQMVAAAQSSAANPGIDKNSISTSESKEKITTPALSGENNSSSNATLSTTAGSMTVESLVQLAGFILSSGPQGPINAKNEAKGSVKPTLEAQSTAIGTNAADPTVMPVLGSQFPDLSQRPDGLGVDFVPDLTDAVSKLGAGDQMFKELTAVLAGTGGTKSGIAMSGNANPSSLASVQIQSSGSDKTVTLSSNDQFVEAVNKSLAQTPIPTPSRITVQLDTPYGAQINIFFQQVGDQVRAQLSANDPQAMQWLHTQLADLKNLQAAQSIIWLPPQMEGQTSGNQFNARNKEGGSSDAEREARSLDLDEVLSTSNSGSNSGSQSFTRN